MDHKEGLLSPGFAEPVRDAQYAFRAVLEAMARPLQAQPCEVSLDPPHGISPEMGAVVLTLCDQQTPLWLSPRLSGNTEVRRWLRFHTGAPIVDDANDALFCLASSADTMPRSEAIDPGTDEQPHLSATIIIEVTAPESGGLEASELSGDGSGCLQGEGPGIDGVCRWKSFGIPLERLEELRGTAEEFPRGVDLLFTGFGAVVGLPRTTVLSRPPTLATHAKEHN